MDTDILENKFIPCDYCNAGVSPFGYSDGTTDICDKCQYRAILDYLEEEKLI